MEQIQLGDSGIPSSRIGLGTWATGGEHMDWSAIGKLAQRDAGMLDLAA